MIPLHVRVYFQTGLISDEFLPLDSILHYHAVRHILGPQDITLPSELTQKIEVELPIQKIGTGADWYYACSFAQWPEAIAEDKSFFVKQIRTQHSDLVNFASKRGKINNRSGQYKSYHVTVYYRHAMHVDWYLVGDPEGIANLLKFCTHFGKKTSQGWGAVLAWKVATFPFDWSVYGREGQLMRAIPTDGEGFLYGIRPSYWLPENQYNCLMPNVKV